MKALSCRELLPALCRLRNQFGLLVYIDSNNAGLAFCLLDFMLDEDDEYCQQIVGDGVGVLMFKDRASMQAVFEQAKDYGHVVYLQECNDKGQYERANYDS